MKIIEFQKELLHHLIKVLSFDFNWFYMGKILLSFLEYYIEIKVIKA